MTKWKLVPVEPDDVMVDAGANVDCIITGIDEIDAPEDYKRVFAAMIEAAPQPPKLSDERIFELIDEYGPFTKVGYIVDFARAIERDILGGNE